MIYCLIPLFNTLSKVSAPLRAAMSENAGKMLRFASLTRLWNEIKTKRAEEA
jgi:hypothetical protein